MPRFAANVAMKIRQYLPTGHVGHFQIAGVPERHEPDIASAAQDRVGRQGVAR